MLYVLAAWDIDRMFASRARIAHDLRALRKFAIVKATQPRLGRVALTDPRTTSKLRCSRSCNASRWKANRMRASRESHVTNQIAVLEPVARES